MDNQERKPSGLRWQRFARTSQSILNGVIGDYLADDDNPLAIEMGLYECGTAAERSGRLRTNKVVVLLHGLTNDESIWDFPHADPPEGVTGPVNYGTLLQQAFGLTPFFLRYNTGRLPEDNGRQFSELMSRLYAHYPGAVDEIVLIGYSMGGLVMRHAQKVAQETNAPWLNKLADCFYLGTPHEGSYLERLGHGVTKCLHNAPRTYLSVWGRWGAIRSRGIKALRYGLADAGAEGFYPGARHGFISGELNAPAGLSLEDCVGDALVARQSACPKNAPASRLSAHFKGVSHLKLAYSPAVYTQLHEWLAPRSTCVARKAYVLSRASEQSFLNHLRPPEPALRDSLLGALDLAATGFAQTLDTVEVMHHSIAAEPYKVLQKVPAIHVVSSGVQQIHTAISTQVFRSIRWGAPVLRTVVTHMKSGDT